MSSYTPDARRYESIQYARCGRSGLKLPRLSLGLWHNFGGADPIDNQRALIRRSFDLGITHFDLANNYGPPPGSATISFDPSGLTRVIRPLAVSVRITLPSGIATGPSGKRKPSATVSNFGINRSSQPSYSNLPSIEPHPEKIQYLVARCHCRLPRLVDQVERNDTVWVFHHRVRAGR